jgi:hypothetical protein
MATGQHRRARRRPAATNGQHNTTEGDPMTTTTETAPTEFRSLCGDVARELAELRGEAWAIDQDDYTSNDSAILTGPDAARLSLAESWQPADKVTISGVYPVGYGRKQFHAGVSASRGARTIAREVSRRVLDAGYLTELARALASKAADDRQSAERLMWLQRVAELTGAHAPTKADQQVSWGNWVAEPPQVRGSVKAYHRGSDLLEIELTAVPAEVALRMLAVLADTPGGPS